MPGFRAREDPHDEQELALRCCRGCPARPECLAYALAAGEPAGVWGATTPAQRAEMVAGARAAA